MSKIWTFFCCINADKIVALVVKQLHTTDFSVTSAEQYYNTLISNRNIEVVRGWDHAVKFNINLIDSYPALADNISDWFKFPPSNITKHDIQSWWNTLSWGYWTQKMKSRSFTITPFDTHSHPPENGRKPACSHIAIGCSKSLCSVHCLNYLKSRGGVFNADDKGKIINLSKAFCMAEGSFRSAGMSSYLCGGDAVIFFLVEESSIIESLPRPLTAIGDLRLLNLLTTNIDSLGSDRQVSGPRMF